MLLAPYYDYIVAESRKLFGRDNSIHLDLANDIYVSVAAKPTTEIEAIITSGKMHAYLSTAIRCERRLSNTRFAKLYKREPNYIEVPKAGYIDLQENTIGLLDDFEKKILALYVRWGTFDKASAKSRIRKATIVEVVNRIKAKIETQIKQ